MCNISLLLIILSICAFTTFQETLALRRIKRGSTGATKETTTDHSNVIAMNRPYNAYNVANKVNFGEQRINESDSSIMQRRDQTDADGTWAKKAVTAVEHAIDKAFSSLTHKSDVEKPTKNAHKDRVPLHYTTADNAPIKPLAHSTVSVVKEGPKASSLAYTMLPNRLKAERTTGVNQYEDGIATCDGSGAGAAVGQAEVVLIDNGLKPIMSLQSSPNYFASHHPNYFNSFKQLAELNKNSNANNKNNNNNNNPVDGEQNGDKRINENSKENKADVILENTKRNEYKTSNSHNSGQISASGTDDSCSQNRNEGHTGSSRSRISSVDNSNFKHNTKNNKNGDDELISQKSKQNSFLQQQQLHKQQQQQQQQTEMKDSFPALLSLTQKSIDDLGELSKLQHQKQQKQLKHEEKQNVNEGGQQRQQQQMQMHFVKHSNGKMLPIESFLKFANMMLDKVEPDGIPMRAQAAQLAVNGGKPSTSVISISPATINEAAEDAETIDYIYNTLDPDMNFMRNSISPIAPPLLSSPFITPPSKTNTFAHRFFSSPFSLGGRAAPPRNLMESALDLLLLGAGEDEVGGNDEAVEIYCPIHQPKIKKSNDGAENVKDKDGIIQVCACRLVKMDKNK